MSDFVHLHVHSEYSLLDGLATTKDLVKQAVANGQSALALTDHGVMHGAIEFFRNAKGAGVKPIIGVEAYMTQLGRKMTDRDPNYDKKRHHLLLLAQNMTGYQNLLKIASQSQLEGFYYKPRVDADFLAAHSEGLICTSGCMAAEIPYLLNEENGPADQGKAMERLQWYLDVFGKERFFIELQEHSIPALTKINKTLFAWAKHYQLQMIVTNDVHYAGAQDATGHDTLLCVQTSSLVNAQKRMRMSDNSYYLKTEEELRHIFRPLADLPDSAFTNTRKIAEMCEVDLEDKSYHLPDLPIELMPPGLDYPGFLRQLTDEGLARLYGDRAQTDEIQQRKEHELGIIKGMNFDVYFLIVWDLCRFAQENNIWWNVRGSGAGSIVAYALGITKIDPLQNQLIFERFLNPGRVSMPDFDLDYPDDQREEMIKYTIERYGEDHVAQIVAFGRMKARAAVRDVGRAHGIELAKVDRIAKMIPAIPGKPVTIDASLNPDTEFYSPDLEKEYGADPETTNLIDDARKLEGVARHASIHAAAVIITDKPLTKYLPLMHLKGSVVTKGVTQFEYPVCESIGLLKVDFLGLSTLTIMRKAAELIAARHGIEYTIENIPMEDPKAFDLLASGNLTGIFQVEGAGMRRLMTDMRPSKFDHIIAAISLYRPGPMENIPSYIARMHGKEDVQFHHADLEPILADTYGIIVYQEQIIRIATALAGYEPGEADMIRKAVAKKKKDLMEKHKIQFTQGALNNGYSQKVINAIWGDIEFFARYGFNKAHAADYAMITCQTAFLKAHYPVEYMTALMTVEQGKTEKIGLLLEEARTMGIEVLPPNVNFSGQEFQIEAHDDQEAIRYGLGAVKNVGEGPIATLLAARQEGPFANIDEFAKRIDLRQVGKRALESMIKVGAMHDFGERGLLLAIIDRMLQLSGQMHQAAAIGQMSMFDVGGFTAPATGSILYPKPDFEELTRKETLAWEKELVGTYVSSHPAQPYMDRIKQTTTCLLSDKETLAGMPDRVVSVAGLVVNKREINTKKGDRMAFITLEDTQGTLEVVVFPRTFKEYRDLLELENLLLVRGKVDAQDTDNPKILADHITRELTTDKPLEHHEPPPPPPVYNGWDAPPPPETNGHSDYQAPPPPPSPDLPDWVTTVQETPPNYPARKVEITLPRSGNLHQDQAVLQRLHELMRSYPGRDEVTLHIPLGSRVLSSFAFPESPIDADSQIMTAMKELVGQERIAIR